MDIALESLVTTRPEGFRDLGISPEWKIPGLVNDTNVDVCVPIQVDHQGLNLNYTTADVYASDIYGLTGGVAVSKEIDFSLRGRTQQGSIQINASLVGFRIGLTPNKLPFKPRLGFGYDLVAGDKSDTPDYETFNTMNSTNHKYYRVHGPTYPLIPNVPAAYHP